MAESPWAPEICAFVSSICYRMFLLAVEPRERYALPVGFAICATLSLLELTPAKDTWGRFLILDAFAITEALPLP